MELCTAIIQILIDLIICICYVIVSLRGTRAWLVRAQKAVGLLQWEGKYKWSKANILIAPLYKTNIESGFRSDIWALSGWVNRQRHGEDAICLSLTPVSDFLDRSPAASWPTFNTSHLNRPIPPHLIPLLYVNAHKLLSTDTVYIACGQININGRPRQRLNQFGSFE